MSNSSIWPIDRTPSGATPPGRSGPESNGNEGVFCILQSSGITEASPLDCLVSYPGHSLGESYLYAEMQSVFSTVLADWIEVDWSYNCQQMIIIISYLRPYRCLWKKEKKITDFNK